MDCVLDQAGSPWRRISNAEYHNGPGASRSFLWDLISSTPYHALWRKQHRQPPTDAMILGSAFHALVLEPELFAQEYVVTVASRRAAAGKEIHQQYADNGITALKQEQWDTVHRMRDAVMSHPIASLLLVGGSPELSLYQMHPVWGFPVKIRPDYLLPDYTIVDLKSCQTAAIRPFRSHAYSMGYHMQAAMYPKLMEYAGLPVPKTGPFVFIACESVEPHCVAVYYADEDLLRDGLESYENACALYHQCITTDTWPAYPEEFLPLNAPSWARFQKREQNVYQS